MRTLPSSLLRRAGRRAFTLLELLVAVGLLTVVVLALYAMFDQTQKALHANIAQTDVMEAGRSVMDLIVRDIERAQSPDLPSVINLAIRKGDFVKAGTAEPFIPPGVVDANHRNFPLNDLFFLTQTPSNRWTAVGFYVGNSADPRRQADENLGTLYRFQDPYPQAARGAAASDRFVAFYTYPKTDFDLNRPDPKNSNFLNQTHRATNSARLMDNVLFFRVLPFARSGVPVDFNTPRSFFAFTNSALSQGIVVTNQNVRPYLATGFIGTTMPSAVELELGMLSPRLWTQYTNQANFELKTNFLAKHKADILVFRQRIPIRSALQ